MFQVPQAVKSFFDSVPLKTITDQPTLLSPQDIYYFRGMGKHPDGHFTLGVFNTIKINDHVVPSDPISLGLSLILANKNQMGLPTGLAAAFGWRNGIIKTSYMSSKTNVLPILIEDTSDNERNIKTLDIVNHELVINNFTNLESKQINELIDIKFYDIWLLCILTENLSYDTLTQIFGVGESTNKLIQQAEILEFLNEIPHWNSFRNRHPYLFDNWTSIQHLESKHLSNYYKQELAQFSKNFDLIIDYLSDSNESSSEKDIIKFKVAGYMSIIDHLLKDTKLYQVINQRSEFVKQCYTLMK
ncbi:SAM35 [[Candida] subhashii]|uniref:SAM35 n=1 Tax=[Candida] subhashii TaxID=561895 RepID=A0A8J5QBG0_9ASCO|nr:SAM35 [[Candida] subhashii]KAG7662196.1 SAM35 [[Candida] subhashii]